MKSFNILMQADGHVGTIDIFGLIGGSFFSDVDARSFREELSALGDMTELDVHIHSPGGEVMEGIAIFNTLKRHPAQVRTFVDGLAGSIASILVFAGEERHMASNAWIMVHAPSGGVHGTADEIERAAKVVQQHEDNLAGIYADNTKLDIEEVKDLFSAGDNWLDAEMALEKGFIDVIDDEVELDVAALTDINQFENVPAMLLDNVNSSVVSQKPDNEEGSAMEITLEMIQEKHPGIVKAIEALVVIPDVAAEVKTAVDAERSRIKDVVSLSRKGTEDLVQELAFDGETTKAEAALKILDKMDALGLESFQQHKDDANEPTIPEDRSLETPDLSTLTPEAQADKMWDENLSDVRSEFIDKEGLVAYLNASRDGRIKMAPQRKEVK